MISDGRSGTCVKQLMRLIKGASELHLKNSGHFYYDDGRMDAEDVAEVLMPSILCLANDLGKQVGFHGMGLDFKIGPPNPVFPIHVLHQKEMAPLSMCAPLVLHTFITQVVTHSHDLGKVYEQAMKTMRPDFHIATKDPLVYSAVISDAPRSWPEPE